MLVRLTNPRRLFLAGLVALAVGAAGTGCATKRPETAPMAVTPRLVGTIALVNEPLKFVLVDVGSLYVPTVGKALKCFSNGTESGVLAVSPERTGPFISADIVKGAPQKGDQVFE